MWGVILQKIPGMLFEPIAIFSICGIVCSIIFIRKEHKARLFFVLFCILFFCVWRVIIVIISSRYSIILLFPAIIFSVYFCFCIPKLIEYFSPNRSVKFLWISYCIAFILLIACLGKTFRVNPFSGYIIQIADDLKKNINFHKNYNIGILADDKDGKRMEYYADHPIETMDGFCFLSSKPDFVIIKRILNENKFKYDILWIVLKEQSTLPPLKPEDLDLPETEWELERTYYINTKKKSQMRLYRYSPSKYAQLKVTEAQRAVLTNISHDMKKNIIRNGDFEESCQSSDKLYSEMNNYSLRYQLENPVCKKGPLPPHWNFFGLGGYALGSNPQIWLDSVSPISGNKSLHVRCDSMILFYALQVYHPGNYYISFFCQARKQTKIRVGVILYPKSGRFELRYLMSVELSHEKLNFIRYTLAEKVFEKSSYFRIFFQMEYGDVLIDDVAARLQTK